MANNILDAVEALINKTDDEKILMEVNWMVVHRIDAIRRKKAYCLKENLAVGDTVRIGGSPDGRYHGEKGKVYKIKQTKALVALQNNNVSLDIPMNMLKII